MTDAALMAADQAAPAADTKVTAEQVAPPQPVTDKALEAKLYPDKPTEQKAEPAKVEPKVEEKKADTKAEEKAEVKRAPERYEFAIPDGMPEGFTFDKTVHESLAKAARDLDLSQDQAQTLVNEVWPVLQRRGEEHQIELIKRWSEDTKADPEIGGSKLQENLGVAKLAVKKLASEGMQELLNGPIGSHPEVIRFLVKVGRLVSEDTFVGGERRGPALDLNDESAIAAKLYPKSQMQA